MSASKSERQILKTELIRMEDMVIVLCTWNTHLKNLVSGMRFLEYMSWVQVWLLFNQARS